jgi:CDP-diacylglycerol--glycerol-3-phosphate 3-phosphatidyltransferase
MLSQRRKILRLYRGLGRLRHMVKSLPNILTLARLGLTGIFLLMILYSPRVGGSAYLDLTFILFVITSLTDIVDGHIARRFNATSKFGRIADPLADKVLVCGAFICFALIGRPRLFDLPAVPLAVIHWSIVAILVAREAYVTILRHVAEARGINFAATKSGKFKMLTQTFAIGTVLVKMAHVPAAVWADYFTSVIFVVMIVATVVSGVLATKRSSWQQARAASHTHEPSAKSA